MNALLDRVGGRAGSGVTGQVGACAVKVDELKRTHAAVEDSLNTVKRMEGEGPWGCKRVYGVVSCVVGMSSSLRACVSEGIVLFIFSPHSSPAAVRRRDAAGAIVWVCRQLVGARAAAEKPRSNGPP